MSEKIVCQLDHDGYFVGVVAADPSPLEEGVWLIPARCVESDPPKEFPGQRVRWEKGEWKYEDIPVPPQPPVAPVPTAKEICKTEAKYRLVQTDWTQYGDVSESLLNKSAFNEYRAQLRALFLKPVDEPEWPVEPQAVWSE